MTDLGLTCMIALDEPDGIFPDSLARTLHSLSPKTSVYARSVPGLDAESALMADVDGHQFVVAVMAGQIPEPDLTKALKQSLFWRDARSAISGHKAFAVLTAIENHTVLGLVRAQAIALTTLAAGVAECLPSQGLYWRGADGMVPPTRLLDAQREISRDYWPVDIWIGYSFYREDSDDGLMIGVQSRGAVAYLGFEIEVPPIPIFEDDWKEPLRILFATIAHLIALGQKIRDGQHVQVPGERRTSWRLHTETSSGTPLARLTLIQTAARA